MSVKNRVSFCVILLIVIALALPSIPSYAQDSSPSTTEDFPVSVKLTGTITTLTSTSITLVDGSTVTVNDATKGLDADITVGVLVTITADVDNEIFIAKSISLGQNEDDAAATSAVGTPEPTAEATSNSSDIGKGKNSQGTNKDDKGKGKGNSSQGNDNSNAGDKGKARGKGNNDSATNGKNSDKGKSAKDTAACLANLKHPVALRLADLLNVSYAQIMAWHCSGIGFGELTRAYLIAQKMGMTVDKGLALPKGGAGWGKILHRFCAARGLYLRS